LNSPEPNSVFPSCEGESRVAESLLHELRDAELSIRGGSFHRESERLGGASALHQERARRGRFFDFIWLVYSVFFVIEPVQQNTRKTWMEFALGFGCFLAIYTALVLSRSKRTQYLLLFALAALGTLYFPFNSGASGMFIYVAAFIPFITESIFICIATIAACCATMMLEGWALHMSPWSWAFCAFFSVAVGAGNLVAAQRMRANKKLDLAHEQIAHLAKLAERERIARDLHDVLGHTLSVVVLKSELAGKVMDREPQRARIEIREVEQIARKALTEVREAIRGYRSEGLTAEIARAQKTLDAAGVTLECCGIKPAQLAPAEETVLSLIVREAVTNIVRHAQASRCRLEFAANGSGTALVVEDDGRGGIHEEGNGLRGMRERVESMGGKLQIDSGQGTRLLVEIPPHTVD
jgi:two-component system, NarL family, sensor histidine kinase DesK